MTRRPKGKRNRAINAEVKLAALNAAAVREGNTFVVHRPAWLPCWLCPDSDDQTDRMLQDA